MALLNKYAVRRPHPDCEALGPRVWKVEYATDEEGRLWRRIFHETGRMYWGKPMTAVIRWHIADPWAWFPGADAASRPGVRLQNTRARPPRKVDVYLCGGVLDILPRPPYPSSPQERNS